ncbi:hypothetical protein [Maricaulis sp. CAU 1757]
MPQSYSMPGFHYREIDGIIELHAAGQRPTADLRLTERLVEAFKRGSLAHGVLNDVREAHYDLSAMQMRERCHLVARQLAPFRVATIIRADQVAEFREFQKAHAAQGGTSAAFASVEEGRAWLTAGCPRTALGAAVG